MQQLLKDRLIHLLNDSNPRCYDCDRSTDYHYYSDPIEQHKKSCPVQKTAKLLTFSERIDIINIFKENLPQK